MMRTPAANAAGVFVRRNQNPFRGTSTRVRDKQSGMILRKPRLLQVIRELLFSLRVKRKKADHFIN